MDINEPLKRLVNPDNIRDAQTQVNDTVTNPTGATVTQLSEVTQDLGDQYAGRFIAPSVDSVSSEPTSTDFSGSFLSGDLQTMPDATQDAWLANATSGVVEFSVGDEGIYQNRLTNGYKHIADDGTTYRKGLLGMSTLDGLSAPSFGLDYSDNSTQTDLITNGDFETGSLTGWTASAQVSINNSTVHSGTYSARFLVTTAACNMYQIVAVTAANQYLLEFYRYSGGLNVTPTQSVISWYTSTDGTGSAISTITTNLDAAVGWFLFSKRYTAPTGAQSAKVYIYSDVDPYIIYIDDVSFTSNAMGQYIKFEPIEGKIIAQMLDSFNDVGQIPVAAYHIPRVDETKDKLTAAQGTTDPAALAVGTYYYACTFVDVYGETDADLSQATSLTIATEAKRANLTTIPLGKWGTTARRIYRSASTDSTDPEAYFLVTTISDNTTTTYTDTTPTGSLSTTMIPTTNTTGSRPAFPRTARIFGDAVLPTASLTNNFRTNHKYGYEVASTTPAQNEEFTAGFWLEAGTYSIKHYGVEASNRGICHYYLDDVAVGTADFYNAATTVNVTETTASVSVPTSGWHRLTMRMETKNGASTNYAFTCTYIEFLPSAY